MNGRQALEALRKELADRLDNDAWGNEHKILRPIHHCIRAALASKDTGPSADGLSSPGAPGSGGSAGGLATRVHVVSPGHNWGSQMWSVVQDDGGLFCLTFYADSAEGGRAREVAELIARAVNALPQDAGEPKP